MYNEKYEQFLKKFPLFFSTIERLNQENILWLISGSGCLFLLGNKRLPDDVDIFLKNTDHDKADSIFKIKSFTYSSETENVRNSNPEGNHDIQLTSNLKITIEGSTYDLAISETVIENKIVIEYKNFKFNLLPPEDVLIIKAILQRGEDAGKHDIEDIKNFMELYTIDKYYLSKRIKEIGCEERVSNIFN